jgi:hypothetical protein
MLETMREEQWLACMDPEPMLKFLGKRCTPRKLHLIAIACCRRIRHLITQSDTRRLLDLAPESVDRAINESELRILISSAWYAGFKEIDRVAEEDQNHVELDVNWAVADIFASSPELVGEFRLR